MSAPKRLTVEEFRKFYSGAKPYYEFWFGMPSKSQGQRGYMVYRKEFWVAAWHVPGTKQAPRWSYESIPIWEPVPDLIATRRKVEQPYPTAPVEIVVEILSPDDRMMQVLQKCRHYSRIGIAKIFVLDPEGQEGWEWNSGGLKLTTGLKLMNGAAIELDEVWRELQKQA